jgi:hypothetical protein
VVEGLRLPGHPDVLFCYKGAAKQASGEVIGRLSSIRDTKELAVPAADPITFLAQGVVRQLLWLLPLGLALPALKVLFVPMLRGRAGEARVAAVLDRVGADRLHDVILPDGRGGSTQVDHLVLTGAGILVVETKNYRGSVYGREHEAQWTQRLGRRSFPFQNPLRQNYGHVQAVKALAPGRRCWGGSYLPMRRVFRMGRLKGSPCCVICACGRRPSSWGVT